MLPKDANGVKRQNLITCHRLFHWKVHMHRRAIIAFGFALIAFLFIFSFLFAPHLLSVIAWGRIIRTPPVQHRTRVACAAAFWADIAFRICAWLLRIRVDFHPPPCGDEPLIVISNHQATLDILLIAYLLRRCGRTNLRWVLKSALLRVPIIGIVSREMGCASVSRDRNPDDLIKVTASTQLARADGATMIVFPEGTRFTGPDCTNGFQHVRSPKRGGFKTIRDELPRSPILSVTLCWHPPVKHGHGKTMFQGAAFYGKTLIVSAEIVRPEEIDADPNWLKNAWGRMDDAIARIRDFHPSPNSTA